jgi:hypothetical protein
MSSGNRELLHFSESHCRKFRAFAGIISAYDGIWGNNHIHYPFQPDYAPGIHQA